MTVKLSRPGLPAGLLLAFAADGAAWGVLHGYGPLYLRQALGEGRFSMLALSTGLVSLATFIMSGVWGRWADAGGNAATLARRGLLAATALLLLFPLADSTAPYIALAVATAACLAVTVPVGLAWALAQVPLQPGRQAGRCYQARALGAAAGSLIGGLMVQAAGMGSFLHMLRLVALIAAAAALALRRVPESPAQCGRVPPAGPEPEAPHTVWQSALVPAIALVVFLSFGSNEAFFALLGPYYTEYLGGSPAGLGAALSIAGVVGLLAVGWVGRLGDSRPPAALFLTGVVGYIGVYGLLCALREPAAALILFAVPIQPFMAIGATGLLNQHLPATRRAEAMGAYEGSAALALAGGSLAAGLGADRLGLAALPLISLAMAAAGAMVTVTWLLRLLPKSLRGSPSPGQPS